MNKLLPLLLLASNAHALCGMTLKETWAALPITQLGPTFECSDIYAEYANISGKRQWIVFRNDVVVGSTTRNPTCGVPIRLDLEYCE